MAQPRPRRLAGRRRSANGVTIHISGSYQSQLDNAKNSREPTAPGMPCKPCRFPPGAVSSRLFSTTMTGNPERQRHDPHHQYQQFDVLFPSHGNRGIQFSRPSLPWTCDGRGTIAPTRLWRQLDPDLWELTQNPWVVLQTVSRDKLQRMLAEPAFRERVDALVQARRESIEKPAWFQQTSPAIAPELRRVFQHGVHAERSPADLFRRIGQRGRRSVEGAQRSRRAGRRRGAALPAGLLSPDDRQRRDAAGAVSVQRSRAIADHAAAPAGRRVAAARRSRCPATRFGFAPGRCKSAG